MQSHLVGTEALVHAIGLFTTQEIPTPQRVDSCYSCLMAARSWYDSFFALPDHIVPGLPFMIHVMLSHMQDTIYRLNMWEDPAWDKQLILETANPLVILDKTIDRLVKAGESHFVVGTERDGDPGNFFRKAAKYMLTVRNAWEPILEKQNGGLPTPESQNAGTSGTQHGTALGVPPMDMSMASVDDMIWMSEMFGPWELENGVALRQG